MWLHYSLYRPQSIHKIVPNRINWFVLTMGLALETSAFASLYYTTRIAARRPGRIMFASPPSSHSAHPLSPVLESGAWKLLTDKRLIAVYLESWAIRSPREGVWAFQRSCLLRPAWALELFVAIRYSMNTYPICDSPLERTARCSFVHRHRNRAATTIFVCEE